MGCKLGVRASACVQGGGDLGYVKFDSGSGKVCEGCSGEMSLIIWLHMVVQ